MFHRTFCPLRCSYKICQVATAPAHSFTFPDIILTESPISDRPVEVRHEAEDRLEVLDGAQQELVDHAEGLDDEEGRGRQIEEVLQAFISTMIL